MQRRESYGGRLTVRSRFGSGLLRGSRVLEVDVLEGDEVSQKSDRISS